MEYLLNMRKSNREADEKYFYWIIGHHADINGFYDEIVAFISQLDSRNVPYILINSNNLNHPADPLETLHTIWKEKLDIFSDADINKINNKELMIHFLRNFIVRMNIEKTNLILSEIENALNRVINVFIKINYKKYYVEKSKQAFMSKLKSFLFKCIYWHNEVIYPHLLHMNLKDNNTIEKIVYYDNVDVDQLLFLSYLRLLGFDVLAIDCNGEKNIRDIYLNELPVIVIEYEYKSPPKQLAQLIAQSTTVSTVAADASKEISIEIFNVETGIFKPKQLLDLDVKALLLKAIHEEILQVLNMEIRFRDGFQILKNVVYSPQLFVKIDGVSESRIQSNVSAFGEFYKGDIKGWTAQRISTDDLNQISQCVVNRELSLENVFDNFDSNLAVKMKQNYQQICSISGELWNKNNEYLKTRKASKIIESTMKFLLTNQNYVYLLKKIDLPFMCPKVILDDVHMETNRPGSNTNDYKVILCTYALFSFLMGFDVVLFSYTCDVMVENFLNKEVYQKIVLPDVYTYDEAKELSHSLDEYINKPKIEKPIGTIERIINLFK